MFLTILHNTRIMTYYSHKEKPQQHFELQRKKEDDSFYCYYSRIQNKAELNLKLL